MPERDWILSLREQLPFPDDANIIARELLPPRRAVQVTFLPKYMDAVAHMLCELMDQRIEILEVKTVIIETVEEKDVLESSKGEVVPQQDRTPL